MRIKSLNQIGSISDIDFIEFGAMQYVNNKLIHWGIKKTLLKGGWL